MSKIQAKQPGFKFHWDPENNLLSMSAPDSSLNPATPLDDERESNCTSVCQEKVGRRRLGGGERMGEGKEFGDLGTTVQKQPQPSLCALPSGTPFKQGPSVP